MMLSGGRAAALDQPRVLQIQVSRYTAALPRPGEGLRFLVAFHVEGSATTWQRNVSLSRRAEERLLEQVAGLRLWSAGLGLTRRTAQSAALGLGRGLRDAFLGRAGLELIARVDPTAILLFVDETIVHLPWEHLCDASDRPLLLTPFSRVVTSRVLPERGRDPHAEEPAIRVLVVENPTGDLAARDRVVEVLGGLGGSHGDVEVQVEVLRARRATRRRLEQAVAGQAFDIVHFAGHGAFDPARPSDAALVLNDGVLSDEDVLRLGWAAPPFIVFNSSCESGRAAPGRRIVVGRHRANGLAAAFLGRGVEAYLGHYFPVPDASAARCAEVFYGALFNLRNVGQAVQEARRALLDLYAEAGDVTAFGLTFFGDAGTAKRADLATAA